MRKQQTNPNQRTLYKIQYLINSLRRCQGPETKEPSQVSGGRRDLRTKFIVRSRIESRRRKTLGVELEHSNKVCAVANSTLVNVIFQIWVVVLWLCKR